VRAREQSVDIARRAAPRRGLIPIVTGAGTDGYDVVTPKEETEFWLGYIRAGIVVTIGTLIAVLPYIALVAGDPARRPLWLVPVVLGS
jgi:hypothetical protein